MRGDENILTCLKHLLKKNEQQTNATTSTSFINQSMDKCFINFMSKVNFLSELQLQIQKVLIVFENAMFGLNMLAIEKHSKQFNNNTTGLYTTMYNNY